MKVFTLLVFLSIVLNARENPFFPSNDEIEIPFTTNEIERVEPLRRATISLPSTARTLESVTLKYKELDGSIHSKTVTLHNSIDWHLPFFISQNYEDGSPKTEQKQSYKKIAGLKFIKLYESSKSLKIVTKDKMLRNFLLTKPHRIVCDFKHQINIKSYERMLHQKGSIITKIRIGNHKGYYRLVIELDGYYRYRKTDIKNGYLFTFI